MAGWLIYLLFMLLGCGLYAAVLLLTMPGLYEERFGRRSLPAGFDEWREDRVSPEGQAARQAGRIREERYFLARQPSLLLPGRLHKQARIRNAATGEIERVEPDRRASFKELGS